MTPLLRVRIEPLSPDHIWSGFSCGVRRVDSYIRAARALEAHGLSRLFVAVEPGDRNARGYYALHARHIDGANVPQPLGRLLRLDAKIPVVEVVMLGVTRPHQHKGVGRVLLADALRRVKRVARDIGIWAIVLEAYDARAEGFYRRLGFDILIDGTRTMYLPVASIA